MSKRINLNADVGEGFGPWSMGDDLKMLDLVGAANVACGFHAGDPQTMQQTIRWAIERGVSIGAHPSFPDLQGFGRRRMSLSESELEAVLIYQIGALQAMAKTQGASITHVKPHGALSNMACEDKSMALTVARALRSVDADLILLAPALSHLAHAGTELGLRVKLEVFSDRAYAPDGQLLPRSMAGAVLHEPEQCVAHVLAMLAKGGLCTVAGTLPCQIDSVCVHGDTPGAVHIAGAVRQALVQAGYELVRLI